MALQPGDRVELVATDDPSTRLRPGDRGTVTGVRTHPEPTIDVHWDEPSTLSVLPEAGDHLSKLPGDHTPTHADPASGPPTTTRPPAGQPGSPAALSGQTGHPPGRPPADEPPLVPPAALTLTQPIHPRDGDTRPHQEGPTVGTRPVIARPTPQGGFCRSYCHYDGYPPTKAGSCSRRSPATSAATPTPPVPI
jgi:hypothetical protein